MLAPLLLAAACSTPTEARKPEAASDVVAEVNGARITRDELDRRAEERLAELRQQQYEIRRSALDEMIEEKLLDKEAAARSIDRKQLLEKEVDAKVTAPTAAQVQEIYDHSRARAAGQSLADVRPQIEKMLQERGREQRRQDFSKELRQRARVAVRLEVPRTTVEIPADAPVQGPKNAPVTVVEFADYQCGYCRRAQPAVEELMKQYRGRVRLVHMDFPLDSIHPRAFSVSRATRCAAEQGKFWELHNDIFGGPPGDLSEADLKRRAEALGLKLSDFSSCAASDRHDAAIRAAVELGTRVGVRGTPTFFVNGRMLVGARSLQQFQDVIEEELSRTGS